MRKIENDCVGCDVCYNCGRKEVEYVYCDKCGESIGDDFYEHDGGEYCYDCWLEARGYDESLTEDNARLFGENNEEDITLNGFLSWLYTREEIEDILWADFEKAPAERQRLWIDDFANNDKENWLEEIGL